MAITIVEFTNDKDSDLMDDTWELEHDLDPNDPDDAVLDNDNDGLINLVEYDLKTDPELDDTDSMSIQTVQRLLRVPTRWIIPKQQWIRMKKAKKHNHGHYSLLWVLF